jgi:hypothetical protein
MQSIINKIKEDIVDRIVEVFWVAIKAAVMTAIILLLLRILPPVVRIHQDELSWLIGVMD